MNFLSESLQGNFESTRLGLVREIDRSPFEAFSTEFFTKCQVEHLNPLIFRIIALKKCVLNSFIVE
jgi:hypothetical protein